VIHVEKADSNVVVANVTINMGIAGLDASKADLSKLRLRQAASKLLCNGAVINTQGKPALFGLQ
jgi:hypothetical protein